MAASNVLADKRAKTLRMVQIALLAALEVILTLLYIPLGTINLNFGLVPIVVAGVLLSPLCGALIGAVSGLVTMIQVLTGQSVFYMFLVETNPAAACVLCVVKTAAAGLIAGLAYKAIAGIGKNAEHHRSLYPTVGSVVSAVLCPVVNTGVFAVGMIAVFGPAIMNHPEISQWGANLTAIVFLALIGVNFFVEFALNIIVCPVLLRTLMMTRFFRK